VAGPVGLGSPLGVARAFRCWVSTPSGLFLHPQHLAVRSLLLTSLLHWRPKRLLPFTQARRAVRSSGVGRRRPPEPTVVEIVENSVCSRRPVTMAECPSMKSPSNDRAVAKELYWPWNPPRATRRTSHAVTGILGTRRIRPKGPHQAEKAHRVSQPNPRGSLRVKDTATPEVKFLDRCKMHGGEGVLQVLVRRSRMRVWGAKRIRHPRSPAL